MAGSVGGLTWAWETPRKTRQSTKARMDFISIPFFTADYADFLTKRFAPLFALMIQVVESLLQFIAFCHERGLIGVRRDVDWRGNVDAGARKGFRNLETVPTRQRPVAIERHRDRHDRVS